MSDKDDPKGMRKGLTSYGDAGFSLFLRKAFIKGAGYTDSALQRPVIGIANTGSSYNPCHGNAPQLIEAVKRGVMLAGGLPMDFPTISVHESFSAPTSMFCMTVRRESALVSWKVRTMPAAQMRCGAQPVMSWPWKLTRPASGT